MIEKKLEDYNWESDIVDKELFIGPVADLIIARGEALLKDTEDSAASITVKAEKIITLLIPIASALLVFLFNPPYTFSFLWFTAALATLVILISLYFCYRNYKSYDVAVMGEHPRNMATRRIINKTNTEDQQYAYLALSHCRNIQNRIDINVDKNHLRLNDNVMALKAMRFLILCPLVGWLLFQLFHLHCS